MDKKLGVIGILILITLGLVLAGCTTGEAKGGKPGKPGGETFECSDGIDNDGDGKCDFAWKKASCSDGSAVGDPGCISKDDNDESTDCVPACNSNSDCGTSDYVGDPYCKADGNRYRDYKSYTCENAGKCSAVCNEQTSSYLWQNCLGCGCSNGACIPCGNQTG